MQNNNRIAAETKKFLFVSLESLSGDLAWQLVKEGHAVKAYIKEKSDADVYLGFIERIDEWKSYVDWADVVVFDDIDFGNIADELRKKGKYVVGGSAYTDRLEIDREFGQDELKKYGVNTLPGWHFSDYSQAIDFIKKNPDRYAFKPSGNTPSGGKGLLFLGQEEDGRDLIELLEQNKNVWQKKAPIFLLQKFVFGVEIAVGAFFNGQDFIYPININFEHKKIFSGNIGPFSGEMGTLMFWSENNYLFEATLQKMLPAIRDSGYIGYIDLNCIVNGRGIYPLEFTSRFGYPTIHIQLEGILTPVGEWLYQLSRGEQFRLKTKRGFQIGVRVLAPPYLTKKDTEEIELYHDLAVSFKKANNLDGIHIEDVKKDEDGIWRIAGVSGCVIVVTASGTTVEEARHLAYSRIKNVMIPNMFYRTDIGLRWGSDSDKLRTWGYI
ncbi:MAG: phosphoribosylamine--glycine ligase [Candidatus Wildermuthbacteria bacterium RIFCSPHIGHO2_01_FULL_47_27]|uniref:phosphoribosylamine--glycine ligase n=1 Tax=Candidatus Wildermuthbacteria bacterium RIFCSPHIGHO2_02_FULL_47_17 TaxID=1802452 RepID=A0A1G2R2W8_9BACT|nr:MAG: Phosphoribosylamine/glycine ligase [Parcubacteria group bacterium GW2011_GWA2_47_9]OHA64348.1 MAG: phosphoribosylamine--glycine ligase [Candidatus Wildermuthbacteria bacterium RIFCSPHIGHO2_01_FULL_47_27]OHA66928.1 MAG: phosphoribosylamine--glycine ligase [Candidatus Wildermuthbacteria bacterium RIFCSPHIGHO2_02_FULL_47_17]OHA74763.1 MAG: phosphoribosylamine--glycine ligase [Candidatus Wildermuthbacteria bacterium RIFCSPLOWO2_02_FULL_47_10]